MKICKDIYGIRESQITLIGQSLGTGIVVEYCKKTNWKNPIILLSPYKSIVRVQYDPHWLDIIANSFIDNIDLFQNHRKIGELNNKILK